MPLYERACLQHRSFQHAPVVVRAPKRYLYRSSGCKRFLQRTRCLWHPPPNCNVFLQRFRAGLIRFVLSRRMPRFVPASGSMRRVKTTERVPIGASVTSSRPMTIGACWSRLRWSGKSVQTPSPFLSANLRIRRSACLPILAKLPAFSLPSRKV